MEDFFKDKVLLITGGAGTIGSNILDLLLKIKSIKKIRVLDNRETELFYLQEMSDDKNDKIRYIYGDIRDKNRLRRALEGVDIVFHTAALKHVPNCEYNPMDAIYTNVIGTQNLIEVALELNIEKFIYISTDKAVNPTTVMGATKLLGERLIHSMYLYKGNSKTNFSAVRFGNVFKSRGSVIDLWEKQIANGQKITITDIRMTRFFIKIKDAVNLVINSSIYGSNGSIFILKMKAMNILDLAEVFLSLKGLPIDYYTIKGIRPGEKLHEELIIEGEEELLYENNEMFVKIFNKSEIIEGFNKSNVTRFSSKDYLITKDEIKDLFFS